MNGSGFGGGGVCVCVGSLKNTFFIHHLKIFRSSNCKGEKHLFPTNVEQLPSC